MSELRQQPHLRRCVHDVAVATNLDVALRKARMRVAAMCDRFDRDIALRGWRVGCNARGISRDGIACAGPGASGHRQAKSDHRHPPSARVGVGARASPPPTTMENQIPALRGNRDTNHRADRPIKPKAVTIRLPKTPTAAYLKMGQQARTPPARPPRSGVRAAPARGYAAPTSPPARAQCASSRGRDAVSLYAPVVHASTRSASHRPVSAQNSG